MPDVHVLECLTSLGLSGPRFDDLDAALLADGRGLSTGEKVRLVLARALLADAELLFIDDVAGVLDDDARRLVRRVLDEHPMLCVVEATVDTPLLTKVTARIELAP
jgi:ABC-type transport system involved in cytochrome bd biosynthesis fused ATPase/permease subunit